ncbi:SDR family oxidoreductase [Acetobacter sp. AN02]|uniref:SDR family NAD(P)-dependent oxidoreductase n=1 Tax=Acetobacter sp. AN02 TaxID=2894186 RepID=UPI00243444CE|nr:SDR family oxidoreductase [Acetobacter sp. AN02]MDG6095800.1 SDR family oxidoreductase [Acetobacter sp. AN02]
MTDDFKNKVAFVSGAASGIGFVTAKAFAEAGAAVAITDLNEEAAFAAAKDLTEAGHRAIGIACDVTDEASVEGAVSKTVAELGGLDFAYNNAGLHVPSVETADALAKDFDLAISVNLKGVWLCMKHQLRHMRDYGGGAIVNCSSQSGLAGIAGLGAYTASKHAVIGLTKAAALEYARKGIRINAICPGTTDTPMVAAAMKSHPESMQAVIDDIPLGRMAKGEEIASAVLWLCSPGAGFMIGQIVAPDGGYTAK